MNSVCSICNPKPNDSWQITVLEGEATRNLKNKIWSILPDLDYVWHPIGKSVSSSGSENLTGGFCPSGTN